MDCVQLPRRSLFLLRFSTESLLDATSPVDAIRGNGTLASWPTASCVAVALGAKWPWYWNGFVGGNFHGMLTFETPLSMDFRRPLAHQVFAVSGGAGAPVGEGLAVAEMNT